MAQFEKDKVRAKVGKRSKADLYKLSNPHKNEVRDEWGDVAPDSDTFSDSRPRINRSNKERRK